VGTEQAEGNLTIGGKNANYNSEREELPFIWLSQETRKICNLIMWDSF
jgi:hypothetical protein